jgi:hypothetical protein
MEKFPPKSCALHCAVIGPRSNGFCRCSVEALAGPAGALVIISFRTLRAKDRTVSAKASVRPSSPRCTAAI